MEAFYREMKSQGFGLITVTQDAGSEVLKMVDYNDITHPIVCGAKDVFTKYHAYDGKHYLIGSDGKILAAFSKLGISIPIIERELAKHGIKRASTKIPSRAATGPALKIASIQQKAKDPVIWSGPKAPVSGAAGAKLPVSIGVTIAPGWYIYALSQKPGGPTPLTITVPADQPFRLAGPVTEPKPEVKFDAGFGMEVLQLKGDGQFALPLTVAKTTPGKRTIVVEARYQACNANLCLPAKTDRIEIPVVLK